MTFSIIIWSRNTKKSCTNEENVIFLEIIYLQGQWSIETCHIFTLSVIPNEINIRSNFLWIVYTHISRNKGMISEEFFFVFRYNFALMFLKIQVFGIGLERSHWHGTLSLISILCKNSIFSHVFDQSFFVDINEIFQKY